MTLVAIFFVRNVALNDHGHVEVRRRCAARRMPSCAACR